MYLKIKKYISVVLCLSVIFASGILPTNVFLSNVLKTEQKVYAEEIPQGDETAPVVLSVPANLKSVAIDKNSITVQWDTVEGATGYEIEADGTILNTGISQSYMHQDLAPNTAHTYRVRAKNGDDSSEWSPALTVATLEDEQFTLTPYVTVAGTNVILTWDEVQGAIGYDLEVDGTIIDNGTSITYVHRDLLPGSSHTYRLRVRLTDGASEWGETVTKTVSSDLLPAPLNVSAETQDTSITVSWDRVAGATGYDIEVDGTVINNVSGASYQHNGLLPDTLHTYRVRAVNGDGCGGWSNYISEKTKPSLTQNSAEYLSTDITTQGNWKTKYGAEGYDIMGDGTSLPSYAHISFSGEGDWTWNDNTTETRALQKPNSETERIAACKHSWGSMTMDVVVDEDVEKDLAIYALDWDSNIRSMKVELFDGDTDELIDTRNVDNFHDGIYLRYKVKGHLKFKFTTTTTGYNCLISGLFFGGALKENKAAYVSTDTTTQGNWKTEYGAEGYDIIGDGTSLPSYAEVDYDAQGDWTWANTTADKRALQKSSLSKDRVASCKYSNNSITLDITINENTEKSVALYLLDWESTVRKMKVEVMDGDTGEVIDTRDVDGFNGGMYLNYKVKGHIKFRLTNMSSDMNAVISGLFFGESLPEIKNTVYVSTDTTTQGNWKTKYGAEGYDIMGDGTSLPSYAHISFSGEGDWTWSDNTTETRALQKPNSETERIAACKHSWSSMTMDVVVDGDVEKDLAIYALDWDSNVRSMQVEVFDGDTDELIDTRNVDNFHDGIYLRYKVKGHLKFKFTTTTTGYNCLVSGLFFGGALKENKAAYVSTDATTQGNWKTKYGAEGYEIMGAGTSLPANVQITYSGEGDWTWNDNTTETRALQKSDSETQRIAACKHSWGSMTMDVVVGGELEKDLAIYALDWDSNVRSMKVEIFDGDTGALLDTRNIDSFHDGKYLRYRVKGHLVFKFTTTTEGYNCVISGVFFGERPEVPGNLTCISKTENSITVGWDEPTVKDGITGYDIEVDGQIINNGTSLKYTHEGIDANSSHKYRVRTRHINGNCSVWSEPITVKSKELALQAPSNLSLEEVSDDTVVLTWNPSVSDNVAGYKIYRGTEEVGITENTNFTDVGLTPGEVYTYTVKAYNSEGKLSEASNTLTVVTSLSIPLNVKAEIISPTDIKISWAKVQNATEYEITDNGGLVGVVQGTFFIQTDVSSNSNHSYKVRAKNQNTVGNWSVDVIISMSVSIPQNLTATETTTTMTLTWDAVEGVVSYDLEADGKLIENIQGTTYVQKELKPNTIHTYRVRAKTEFLKSEWSESVSKSTQECTLVSGILDKDTVWTKEGSPYVIDGDLTIPEGVTLKIMPGVVIKTKIKTDIYNATIDILGMLIAEGTTDEKIVITDINDESYGGSGYLNSYNNIIGVLNNGKFYGKYINMRYHDLVARDSGEVNIEDSNIYFGDITLVSDKNMTLRNNKVEFGPGGDLGIYRSSSNTEDLILENNIFIGKADKYRNYSLIGIADDGEGAIIIENNQTELCKIEIYNCKTNNFSIKNNSNLKGITLYGDIRKPILEGISGNTFVKYCNTNKYDADPDGIVLFGDLVEDAALKYNNPYTIENLRVIKGITLTIEPGVVIKSYNGDLINYGTISAIGTKERPIIFTSLIDPEYGGKGELPNKEIKGLSGIYSSEEGAFTGEYVKFRYGCFLVAQNKFTLVNSEISNCSKGAIIFNGKIQPKFTLNSFNKCKNFYIVNANYDTMTIDVSYNYWDSLYGPKSYREGFYDNEWNGVKLNTPGIDVYPYIGEDITKQQQYGGNGTNAASGNYSKSFTDLSMNTSGLQLDFRRTYNSSETKEGAFGKGWSFSYIGSIETIEGYANLNEMVMAKFPDGSIQIFEKHVDGSYTSSNSRSTLKRNSDGSYILTTKDQIVYEFNTAGYLVKIKDRFGNAVSINVDSKGKVLGVSDSAGRSIKIIYNTDGQISSITDSMNRKVTYEYSDKKLIKVTSPTGKVTRYGYDDKGFLNEIRDNESHLVESIKYNHTDTKYPDRVQSTTDAYGNVHNYTYSVGKTIIKDSNGHTTSQDYDAAYNVSLATDAEGKTTKIGYDSNGSSNYGEENSVIDRNGVETKYERDGNGNVTKVINPDESYKLLQYDDKNNTVMECDENGNRTYYIYDENGKYLLKKVQPLNGTDIYTGDDDSAFAITTFTYYTDAESSQLGYKVKGLLKYVTDPEGNVVTYTYDQYGNVKTVKDSQNGGTTRYQFNLLGWKLSETSPEGYVTTYIYDDDGNLIKKTLQGSETTRIIYDSEGRKTQEIAPKQYDADKDDITENTYSVDCGYRYTYYSYGKVKTVTDPENNTTTYTYDMYGNVKTETKPNGAVYQYEYDVMNRLVKTYFKENANAAPVLLEEYIYDILSDKRTQKTQIKYLNESEAAITIFIYDYAGRLVETRNADNSTTLTDYNANGTAYTNTDANGSVSYFKYDGQNRLVEKWVPIETVNGTIWYTYTKTEYDKAGRVKAEKTGKNKVTLWNKPSDFITTTYEYYKNGNVKSVSKSSGGKTEYFYDNDGNVVKEVVQIDAVTVKTTEYKYNYLNKPIEKKVHVRKGDLYGNDFSDSEDTALVTTYTYDANGNLETMTTPDGVTTTYSYDNLNRQISMSQPGIDEFGKAATITTSTTYDWEGKQLTAADAKGNITKNTYDARGFLETNTDAKGGVTAYYYDRAGRLIAEVSPQNFDPEKSLAQMNRTEYTYDEMGRLITKKVTYFDTVTGQWTSYVTKAFKYDKNGNVIKELDASGYKSGVGSSIDEKIDSGYGTIYTYNLANKPVSQLDAESAERNLSYTLRYDYDALDRKISETNANGVITDYYYDDNGNLISTKVKKTPSSAEKTTVTNTYDYLGNLTSVTDGNGNITTYEYNVFNQLRKVAYPGDSSIPSNAVTYQYDGMGRLIKSVDSTGTVELFIYDDQGRQLSHTIVKADGSQGITTTASYDVNGNKRFETDGNGVVKEYTYDELNRKVSESIGGQTTNYTYDKNDNLIITTDWRGNSQINVYDPLNRLIEKIDPWGHSIQKLVYNNNNLQIKSYDALNRVTEYVYDKNNRLISTIDPKGNITSKTYDNVGNVSSQLDGKSNTTLYEYDEFNRLVKVINAKNEITSFTYDLNGNKLSQQDGMGNTTTFEYNVMNKLVRRTDSGGRSGAPDNYTYDPAKTVIYKYYADGSMSEKVDRNGITTVYTYDIHGRLISQTVGVGTSKAAIITFTYDSNGNQLTMTDSTGTTVRTYDAFNRVITKTVPGIGMATYKYDITTSNDGQWAISGGLLQQGYWAEGSKDPKNNITLKIYDKAGRLYAVEVNGRSTIYSYYDDGSCKSVTYPDGSKEEYTYYENNKLWTLTNKKADGSILESYTYTYDAAGNQISKFDAKGLTSFTYDKLNRLESLTETNGRVTIYTYDLAGNRLTETVQQSGESIETTYTYDEQNRLTGTSTKTNGVLTVKNTYTYDNNGNMLSSIDKKYVGGVEQPAQTTTYTYDLYNQLVLTATPDGKTIAYKFDGAGLRVQKVSDGKITRYLYEYDKVVLELDGQGNQTARNVYGTNLLTRTVDGETLYYMYNGHGDVTALLHPNGGIAASYYYDAFGNIIEKSGSISNNITFAGYQYDEETGLYYLNARMYDPKTARFIQEDTYTGDPNDPLTLNLYTYCQNEPLKYVDPTGHAVLICYNGQYFSEQEMARILSGNSEFKKYTDGKYYTDAEIEEIKTGIAIDNRVHGVKGYTNFNLGWRSEWGINAITWLVFSDGEKHLKVIEERIGYLERKKESGDFSESDSQELERWNKDYYNTKKKFDSAGLEIEGYKIVKDGDYYVKLNEMATNGLRNFDSLVNSTDFDEVKMMGAATGALFSGAMLRKAVSNYMLANGRSGSSIYGNINEGTLKSGLPTEAELNGAVSEWSKMQKSLAPSKTQAAKFNTGTVVYDASTGKYYYGMNRGVQISGDTLNPTLSKMLPEKSLNNYKLGNCAEVDAVNQALNNGANMKDLYMYTIDVNSGAAKGMCGNCSYTFNGNVANVLSK